ncbi:MAG TPA: hypothetical protein VMS73_07765 [Anaerolineaceae bacterium]|nr:hypothetical protein [Anaerolineaceae bacterium]
MSFQTFLKVLRTIFIVIIILTLIISSQPGMASSQQIAGMVYPGDIGWRSGFFVNGLDSDAKSIVTDGKNVFVGGDFTSAGDIFASHIAVWDGSAWHAIGSGLNGVVYALAVDGRGHLYAGGDFTLAGGKAASGIARWNGQDWESFDIHLNGWVRALAIDAAGNVYVGGNFTKVDSLEVNGIAMWDGSTWHALAGGVTGNTFPLYMVNALAIDKYGFVYAGGSFLSV